MRDNFMTDEIRCILFCLTIIVYIVSALEYCNKKTAEIQKQLLQGLPDWVVEEVEELL